MLLIQEDGATAFQYVSAPVREALTYVHSQHLVCHFLRSLIRYFAPKSH